MNDVAEAIRDSAAAIVRPGSYARIRALRYTPPGWDPATLRQMGELGWIGLRLPEDAGGSGLGLQEQGALLEALGRGLVPEPLIEASATATVLAAAADTALLPAILSGETLIPLAWQEANDTLDAPGTPNTPRRLHALPQAGAPALIPLSQGTRLALLEAPIHHPTLLTQQDGTHAATFAPDLANARLVHPDIGPAIEAAIEEAALGTAFYLLGLAEQAFAITVDHLRTREQFGRRLGSFQALQHRAADLRIALTLTRASTEAAAAALDLGAQGPARTAAVSRAKARAAETALLVTTESIQLHGAIGYTDEHDIGLFLRKAMVLANRYGSPRLHRRRYAAARPAPA